MANDPLRALQVVWQEQQVQPYQLSLAEVHRRAHGLEMAIKWRNIREYTALIIVAIVYGYYLWKFQTPLVRAGSLLSIGGALFVMYQMRKRGSTRTVPSELALSNCLDFYRRELERQRDSLRTVWSWYLLPLVPGLGLFLTGLAIEQLQGHWLPVAGFGAACAMVFAWVVKINRSAACALNREIEQVKPLRRED